MFPTKEIEAADENKAGKRQRMEAADENKVGNKQGIEARENQVGKKLEAADENKAGMNGKQEAQIKGGLQAKGRRALGDIGNLVGALSVSCNLSKVSKEDESFDKPKPCVGGRSLTRTYSANFADNEKEGPLGQMGVWKAKQRRSNGGRKLRDSLTLQASPCKDSMVSCYAAASTGSKSAASDKMHVDEAEQTMTALLTAMSEAVDAEMHDVECPCVDIDKSDIGNPLAVVDFVEDIYEFYRKAEVLNAIPEDYMASQGDINGRMRSILIDWLIEVHMKFKLRPETLYLTINVLDRFLGCKVVSRKSLQLIGVTAMLIACKYEEVFAPEVQHLIYISDKAFSKNEVLDMEKMILNTLSFNLTVPTPYVFIMRFLKAAGADSLTNNLVFFFVDLSMVEYIMVKYPPSLLAAAAVYTAHCTLKKSPLWSTSLQRHSGYIPKQLMECSRNMVTLHTNAKLGHLTVVYRKYKSSKLTYASLFRPAIII